MIGIINVDSIIESLQHLIPSSSETNAVLSSNHEVLSTLGSLDILPSLALQTIPDATFQGNDVTLDVSHSKLNIVNDQVQVTGSPDSIEHVAVNEKSKAEGFEEEPNYLSSNEVNQQS